MSKLIQPADLSFFTTLAAAGSLSAAGRELGVSTAAVSKHLASMEGRLGFSLMNRSTRRMGLTPEGEIYLEHSRRILAGVEELEQVLGSTTAKPSGLLRVNATLGFGRTHVAPLISRFAKRHPEVDVQLQLSVGPPALTEDAYDVCIRFGPPPDARVVARKLAENRRLLCASPAYLSRRGTPKVPNDLLRHNCITIRQGDEGYGVWRLSPNKGRNPQAQIIKVRGSLTSNDGEIAVNWALDGHGIVMRAEWDISRYLQSGRLVQVLPQYDTPDADIYAVYPRNQHTFARVRAFVEFVADAFAQPDVGKSNR